MYVQLATRMFLTECLWVQGSGRGARQGDGKYTGNRRRSLTLRVGSKRLLAVAGDGVIKGVDTQADPTR